MAPSGTAKHQRCPFARRERRSLAGREQLDEAPSASDRACRSRNTIPQAAPGRVPRPLSTTRREDVNMYQRCKERDPVSINGAATPFRRSRSRPTPCDATRGPRGVGLSAGSLGRDSRRPVSTRRAPQAGHAADGTRARPSSSMTTKATLTDDGAPKVQNSAQGLDIFCVLTVLRGLYRERYPTPSSRRTSASCPTPTTWNLGRSRRTSCSAPRLAAGFTNPTGSARSPPPTWFSRCCPVDGQP